ncbi:MAG: hypothetical protein AAF602_24095 [Myxococcota bacterium]
MVLWALGTLVAAEAEGSGGASSTDWLEGRWHVVSATTDRNAPLELGIDGDELVSPAWQVEAVVDCRPTGNRRQAQLRCAVEDATLRLVTYDHWQRRSDRGRVDGLLDRLVERAKAKPVLLEVTGPGRVAALRGQPDPGRLVLELLADGIGAWTLPPPTSGFGAVAQWQTVDAPLLDVPLKLAQRTPNAVDHVASSVDGGWRVTSRGASDKAVLTSPRDRFAFRSTSWRTSETSGNVAVARRYAKSPQVSTSYSSRQSYPGVVSLVAVATLDDGGRLLGREWTVEGTKSTKSLRGGRVRRLAEGEVIELGPSQQLADPDAEFPSLPPWTPLVELSP